MSNIQIVMAVLELWRMWGKRSSSNYQHIHHDICQNRPLYIDIDMYVYIYIHIIIVIILIFSYAFLWLQYHCLLDTPSSSTPLSHGWAMAPDHHLHRSPERFAQAWRLRRNWIFDVRSTASASPSALCKDDMEKSGWSAGILWWYDDSMGLNGV